MRMKSLDQHIVVKNRVMNYAVLRGSPGKPVVFFVGPLGQDAPCFWNPIAAELLEKGCSCLVTELNSGMTTDDISLETLARDLSEIIKGENLQQVDLVCWCSGIKIALEIYEQKMISVRSIFGITVDYNKEPGPFLDMIQMAERVLLEKPHMEGALVAILGKRALQALGGTNDIDRFSGIYNVDSVSRLREFLLLARLFRTIDKSSYLREIDIPVRLLYGSHDVMTPLQQQDIDLFVENAALSFSVLTGASHYLPLEYPVQAATEIWNYIELSEHKDKERYTHDI